MEDRTNYAQSLMHMIKCNLGTGILAMPASFAHAGLINAVIGIPFLVIICTYCVHLLIDSSRHLEGKTKGPITEYANLAKRSFELGPSWLRASSGLMYRLVDGILLVAQIGCCCVYLVFVTDNVVSILASYRLYISKNTVFMIIFPIAILLSYIRTLRRLAILSTGANILQGIGTAIILHYLATDLDKVDIEEREYFKPIDQVALGFGSAMFAFEGISVVLPVYTRLKNSDTMSSWAGIINVSYMILFILNFVMGLCGYLKFGDGVRDSITLNLPPEPLYDSVRAMFTISVFLTYPLQFYVPNEIIWNWAKKNILAGPEIDLSAVRAIEVVVPAIKIAEKKSLGTLNLSATATITSSQQNGQSMINGSSIHGQSDREEQTLKGSAKYEYCCRTAIVILTFLLAVSVPKLNLLMDLIGSITGTALSLTLPAMIHLAAFWDDAHGTSKLIFITVDISLILFGTLGSICGATSSLAAILNSISH